MKRVWRAFIRVMGDIFGNLSSGWFALLVIEPKADLEINLERLIIRFISGILTLGIALIFRILE